MKFILLLFFLISLVSISAQKIGGRSDIPEWSRDLIIYELSTKSFTSPGGPETGTFKSASEKIPYLADLGITGIWLTGHNWADSSHFYGIWTQYAVISPDSIDPSLGTREDLKSFTDRCHRYNIKVFLDIITHGVMSYSPLIKEHPGWFKGGSWGMTDYDWNGQHADLDKWWIKTHTDYVKQCGIDGYRLDVAIYRIDLWKQIKKECANFGHPIVVWSELEQYSEGLCDFHQRQTTLSIQESGLDKDNPLSYNAAKYFSQKSSDRPGMKTEVATRQEINPEAQEIELFSIQLSSHDDGWEHFPAESNPYVSEGSRCTFGYSCMFLPVIPIFMSGEEFDAGYVALPRLTPGLYGEGEKGKGRWLYGSWIQWDQLKEPLHARMLEDVKKMISLRKEYQELLRAKDNSNLINILPVNFKSDKKIPVPYIIWKENLALIVAGNNTDEDVSSTLDVPFEILNFKTQSAIDIWNNRILNVENGQINLNILRDCVPGGGLSVIVLKK
jgi:glycosidase